MAQSRPPQEIIIVDDCSTDATVSIVQRIINANSRRIADGGNTARSVIRLVALKRHSGKPGYVRNCGVAESGGAYIAFLDDDDQWLPDKLETQMVLHAAHPHCALTYTDEYWMRKGTLISHAPLRCAGEELFAAALHKCVIGPSTVIVRREFIDSRAGPDNGFDPTLEIAEDYHLWLRIIDRRPAIHIERPLTIKCDYGRRQLSTKYGYIEKFRIAALGMLLEQHCLSAAHHRLATEVFVRKCDIWARGAARRGRTEEAAQYRRLAERFAA